MLSGSLKPVRWTAVHQLTRNEPKAGGMLQHSREIVAEQKERNIGIHEMNYKMLTAPASVLGVPDRINRVR
jgi:hypothetical protein